MIPEDAADGASERWRFFASRLDVESPIKLIREETRRKRSPFTVPARRTLQ